MKGLEVEHGKNGITLTVRPQGWDGQNSRLAAATIFFLIAAWSTYVLLHGFKINDRPAKPIEALYSIPFWAAAAAFLAAAIQGACRTTVISMDAQRVVIAISGPLRKTRREFVGQALEAAIVGDRGSTNGGLPLRQIRLYFTGRMQPYCLLTGDEEMELGEIVRRLMEVLQPSSHLRGYSTEVRSAPIHEALFKTICAAGVGVGMLALVCRSVIGDAAFAGIFFGSVVAAITAYSIIARTCKCPRCGRRIMCDGLSAGGNTQYTCPACRVVWESPIRVGGPRNR